MVIVNYKRHFYLSKLGPSPALYSTSKSSASCTFVASPVNLGEFLSPGTTLPRIPSPSMYIPDVVRALEPGRTAGDDETAARWWWWCNSGIGIRSCCCKVTSGVASDETTRRVRVEVTTAPNVGDGLAGREDPPGANRPAASEDQDEGVFPAAGVAGRDDGDGEDGNCACGGSCTAHLSAAMSCSRSSRLRANWLSARATDRSVPSTNARTALSTSCASSALVIAPGTASSVAYPRATRSSSATRISSSTRASSLKSSRRARIVCNAEVGKAEADCIWLSSRRAKWQSRNACCSSS